MVGCNDEEVGIATSSIDGLTSSPVANIDPPTPTPTPVDEPPIADIIRECDEAYAQDKVVTTVYELEFEETQDCLWEQNGNLSRLDGSIRARTEQKIAVRLPDAERLCNLKFEFAEQEMEYDDEIFLLFENTILMSSQDYSTDSNFYANTGLIPSNDVLRAVEYDWNKLLDLRYGHGLSNRYCYGLDAGSAGYDERCQVPLTQTFGQIRLDIPQEEILNLAYSKNIKINEDNTSKNINFGFVTIGDNDNRDCRHKKFNFTVKVDSF